MKKGKKIESKTDQKKLDIPLQLELPFHHFRFNFNPSYQLLTRCKAKRVEAGQIPCIWLSDVGPYTTSWDELQGVMSCYFRKGVVVDKQDARKKYHSTLELIDHCCNSRVQ